MLRIEPVLPMLRMEPTLPMLSIDPALPMLRMEPALRRLPTLAKLMMLRELPLLRRFAAAGLNAFFRYAFSLKIHPPCRLSWWAVYGLWPRFVSKPGVGFADGRTCEASNHLSPISGLFGRLLGRLARLRLRRVRTGAGGPRKARK
jgi:hypothetical protein